MKTCLWLFYVASNTSETFKKYISSFFTPLVTEFRIYFYTKPCAPFLNTVSQTWLFLQLSMFAC